MKTTHLKKIFAFLCASILSLSSYAQDKNQLYADAVSVKAGQEVVVPIYLRNDVPICNFEFYLSLPKGVSIKKIGDEIFASEKGERATETHSVACTRMEDGTYYLFEYSSDNKCFPDTEEAKKMPVMYITLGIDQKTPVGDLTGMIKNQLLNHDNGTLSPDEYKPSDVSFVIHVMNSSNFIAVDNVDNEIIKTIKAGDRVELTDGGYKSVSITANINNVNITDLDL